MKLINAKIIGLAALALFPMLGISQTNPVPTSPEAVSTSAPPIAAPPPSAPAPVELPPSAAEVLKLSQAGMGDDVIVAYIKNSQAFYNLTAGEILALKNAGLSGAVLATMLSHDTALRQQMQQSAPPPIATPAPSVSTPSTVAPSSTVQVLPTPTPPPSQVVVEQAPPPPQVEVIPRSPGVDFDWAPGYWAWRGDGWVWVRGTWLHRPHPSMVWVGGHWASHGHGYVWVGGHWR